MALVARYIGVKDILDCYFDKSDTAYFSLWDKSKQICQYNGENKEEGADILREEIERNIKRKYSNILMLCLHPNFEERYKPTSEVEYNAAVKSFETDSQDYGANSFGNIYPLHQKIAALESEVASLRDQLNDDDESDEEIKVSGLDKTISGISQLLAHPAIANLLTVIFTPKNTTSPATTAGGPAPQTVRAVAGFENDEAELMHYLAILEQKGLTLDHIKKLSELPTEKIKMLLTFL